MIVGAINQSDEWTISPANSSSDAALMLAASPLTCHFSEVNYTCSSSCSYKSADADWFEPLCTDTSSRPGKSLTWSWETLMHMCSGSLLPWLNRPHNKTTQLQTAESEIGVCSYQMMFSLKKHLLTSHSYWKQAYECLCTAEPTRALNK